MQNYENSPEYIEDRIAETRARFDRRATELSASLTPDRIVSEAIGSRSGSPADTLDALMHTAKSSPISFLLAGIGLAGIMLNKSTRPTMRERQLPVATDPAERTGDHIHALKAQASSFADDVSEAVGSIQEKASDLLSGASDGAASATGSARETTASYADAAYRNSVAGYKVSRNRAAHLARHAPERAAHIAGDAGSWVRDNPIPVSLAALALGAAAASFISYKRDDEDTERRDDFPRSLDPRVTTQDVPVVQKKPRKSAAVRPAVAKSAAAKATRSKATKPASKRSSPDVSSAIPAGKSKLGENVVSSTSVLGVADGEKKT